MSAIRFLLSVLILTLLGLGYIASQYFWFQGNPSGWATMIDQPAVSWLALVVLVGAVVLALVPSKENGA